MTGQLFGAVPIEWFRSLLSSCKVSHTLCPKCYVVTSLCLTSRGQISHPIPPSQPRQATGQPYEEFLIAAETVVSWDCGVTAIKDVGTNWNQSWQAMSSPRPTIGRRDAPPLFARDHTGRHMVAASESSVGVLRRSWAPIYSRATPNSPLLLTVGGRNPTHFKA